MKNQLDTLKNIENTTVVQSEKKSNDEDCAFCELFVTVAESGKIEKKDKELFLAHIDSGDHLRNLDRISSCDYDRL